MSVRRLAKDQPAHFAFATETMAKAQWWMAKYPVDRKASALIPILWLVQKQEGWISEPAIRAVGELLSIPKIRVLEVATFYTMFNLAPVGTYFVQLCGTTPCMLRGANDLKVVCESMIGPKHTISADGRLSWEEVECLGACVNAPMVQINDYYYEDLTPESFAGILGKLAAGEYVPPGNFVERDRSAPEGGGLTLKDPSLYDGSRARPISLPNRPAPGPADKAPISG